VCWLVRKAAVPRPRRPQRLVSLAIPQLNLTQRLVEAAIAGAVLEPAGRGFQPVERRRRQVAAKEPDREVVGGIERDPSAFDALPAPLGWVLEPLQEDERIDAADRPKRDRGALSAGCSSPR